MDDVGDAFAGVSMPVAVAHLIREDGHALQRFTNGSGNLGRALLLGRAQGGVHDGALLCGVQRIGTEQLLSRRSEAALLSKDGQKIE